MTMEGPAPVPNTRPEGGGWTVGRIVTAAVAIMAVIGVAWLLVSLSQFLLLIFAAVVLACIFNALAQGIGRLTGLKSRGLTLAIAVVVLLLVFIGAFVLFGAQFAQEMNTIGASIPPAGGVEAALAAEGIPCAPVPEALDVLDAALSAACDAGLANVARSLLATRLRHRPDDALMGVLRSFGEPA